MQNSYNVCWSFRDCEWKSKGLSNEKIKPHITASLSAKLLQMNNSRIILRFKGSCLKQDKAFTLKNVVILFTVYELDGWSQDLNTFFILKDCLFRGVKLTENTDPDKYFYSGYGIGFDSRSVFSILISWLKILLFLE